MGIIVRVFKSRQKLLRDNLTPFRTPRQVCLTHITEGLQKE